MAEPILDVQGLHTHFPIFSRFLRRRTGAVRAVDGVDLSVQPGAVLGIVGESGSGKTTVGKTILRLVQPTAGRILFEGRDITSLPQRALVPVRKRMQIVFQDPLSSLNPRMTVGRILAAPFEIHRIAAGSELRDRVAALLRLVGLPAEAASRYPHEFSGGQRQRVGIARALALNPRLVIGDEPVSALDVSIQAQIMNLLGRLREQFGLTYILISHNLGVIAHISDHVAVMYLGRIVESGPRDAVFFDARHPYTVGLLAALPSPDPGARRVRAAIGGDVPSPANPPPGCPFHPRCPQAFSRCSAETPLPVTFPGGHQVACHLHPG